MFNYVKSADTARKLITKFGRDITHTRIVAGTYDPSTDSFTGGSTTITTLKAVILDIKGQDFVNDTLIKEGDRYAIIEAGVNDIATTDQLTIGGVVWTIIRVENLAPAGVNVLFKVYIRK